MEAYALRKEVAGRFKGLASLCHEAASEASQEFSDCISLAGSQNHERRLRVHSLAAAIDERLGQIIIDLEIAMPTRPKTTVTEGLRSFKITSNEPPIVRP